MSRSIFIGKALVTLTLLTTTGYSQITPYNSWRTLIVYTNSTSGTYSDALGNGNMYNVFFAALIDGINQVYEESEVNVRGQIAGVVWDKAYENEDATNALGDLYNTNSVLYRWRQDSILNKYAADVVMVVHRGSDANAPDGMASGRATSFASIWLRYPNSLETFAHEMGHNFSDSGNADHCRYGHRRVFDSLGKELGGPAPDTLSFVLGLTNGTDPAYIDDSVEREVHYAYRGFYTTMAYAQGGGTSSTYPCHPTYTDTHNGTTRTFRFHHQGVSWGMPGGNDWKPEWTGTYSNPNITWTDPVTSVLYPQGADTIRYINRLKYIGASTVTHRDTTTYHRNFSDTLNKYNETIRELRGIPANLTITSNMSLGANEADSQWVYAHFAASNSVTIQPGFRVGEGTSMRITVGGSGGSLAKRSIKRLVAQPDEKALGTALRVHYNPVSQSIVLSHVPESISDITITIYDLKGHQKKEHFFHETDGKFDRVTFSVEEMPRGLYFVQAVAGAETARHQFVKW